MININPQSPRDYDTEVGRGNIPQTSPVIIQGNNPETGSEFEDVWDVGGFMVYPTAGETWEIVSDSALDTGAGTGAQTVVITGLDTDYVLQTEVVTLNGTTPVDTVRTDWFRTNTATVLTAGSTGENQGTIDIRVSGGGNPRYRIRPFFNMSFNSHFTVPAGQRAVVLQTGTFIPKNEDVNTRTRTRNFGSVFFVGGFADVYQNALLFTLRSRPTLDEKTDFRFEAKSKNRAVSTVTVSEFQLIPK